jgi:hypothetical protein
MNKPLRMLPSRVRVEDRTRSSSPRPAHLGRLEWDADTVSATFFVGHNKGKRPENRKGFCATQPGKFSDPTLDERVRAMRTFVLQANGMTKPDAMKHFAASKVAQKGWYKGAPEKSSAYTIFHDPSLPGESSEAAFKEMMRRTAAGVSAMLCQDEVLVVFDTPNGKKTESYSADPIDRAQAAAAVPKKRSKKR